MTYPFSINVTHVSGTVSTMGFRTFAAYRKGSARLMAMEGEYTCLFVNARRCHLVQVRKPTIFDTVAGGAGIHPEGVVLAPVPVSLD